MDPAAGCGRTGSHRSGQLRAGVAPGGRWTMALQSGIMEQHGSAWGSVEGSVTARRHEGDAAVFKLRFPEAQLTAWADRYSYAENDGRLRAEIRPAVLARGALTRDEF